MTFEEWKKRLDKLNLSVKRAQQTVEDAQSEFDSFLEETIGHEATLSGTINMIVKIIDMKAEKSST